MLHLVRPNTNLIYYQDSVMKLWRKSFDAAQVATKPARISIYEQRCKGCGYCVEYCPRGVLKMGTELSARGYYLAVVDDDSKCLACGFCEIVCPEFAVQVSTDNTR
jgi:2-oxoglutarate ferredoxin oxidoreductase subunit delta